VISLDDFYWFADAALDDMLSMVKLLGDERASQPPHLAGANSPYAILTHCLGVMDFWVGQVIAGRRIERDRPAEFVATGRVKDIAVRVRISKSQLREDLATFESAAPPRGVVTPRDAELPYGRTQGGALFHVYAELAQHRGQMEITRDVLMRLV
jgi:hypothetical protein